MTERQRRALLKQHPEVSPWAEFLPPVSTAASADEPSYVSPVI